MKGWGCKIIDFFIPLFFASDTQKDLDRLLTECLGKRKAAGISAGIGNILDGQAA